MGYGLWTDLYTRPTSRSAPVDLFSELCIVGAPRMPMTKSVVYVRRADESVSCRAMSMRSR